MSACTPGAGSRLRPRGAGSGAVTALSARPSQAAEKPQPMPSLGPAAKVPTEVERSAHAASSQHACAVCGRPRSARRRETCSDRCRTALSRKRCQEALQKRDEEIRTTLEVIMRLGQAVLARLGSAAPPQEARRALGSDDLSPTGAPLPSRAGPTPPSPYLPSCAPAASVEAKIRV
jgi:predicted nucleic acid-binding Zn ribbon protein